MSEKVVVATYFSIHETLLLVITVGVVGPATGLVPRFSVCFQFASVILAAGVAHVDPKGMSPGYRASNALRRERVYFGCKDLPTLIFVNRFASLNEIARLLCPELVRLSDVGKCASYLAVDDDAGGDQCVHTESREIALLQVPEAFHIIRHIGNLLCHERNGVFERHVRSEGLDLRSGQPHSFTVDRPSALHLNLTPHVHRTECTSHHLAFPLSVVLIENELSDVTQILRIFVKLKNLQSQFVIEIPLFHASSYALHRLQEILMTCLSRELIKGVDKIFGCTQTEILVVGF